MMKIFPFPDKEASRAELERDLLYPRIPVRDREAVLTRAWDTGVKAAKELMERYPGMSASRIVNAESLELELVARDRVAGKVRYFSEYYSGRKKIILYTSSIALWARHNNMSLDDACELILAHEMFHYLECTRMGLTSTQYMLPRFQIGRFSLGRTGVRALSKIGAHSFARVFYEGRGLLPKTNGETLLQN